MSGSPQGFDRLGDLMGGTAVPVAASERLAAVWQAAVGEDVARHATPLSLRDGRLVVATSSSVWAQTLDLMGERLRIALNRALGEDLVREVRCRPAGWDPGGGRTGPRAVSRTFAPDRRGRRKGRPSGAGGPSAGEGVGELRALTEAEEREIERVRQQAPTEELGVAIAAAMRAAWGRLDRPADDEEGSRG